MADIQFPHSALERGIGYRDPFFLDQPLMHLHHPPLAILIESAQQLLVERLLIGARVPWRPYAPLLDDHPCRVWADRQAAGNLPHLHPFLVQQENCLTLVGCDHTVSCGWYCESVS